MSAHRRNHRGYALPAVLGILLLMGMLVAIAAQRALVAAHEAHLAEVRAELGAATRAGLAQVVASVPDTARLRVLPPGARLDSGGAVVGGANAVWRLDAAGSGMAALTIQGSARVPGAPARSHWVAWLRPGADPAGRPRWVLAGPGWWVRLPDA